MPNDQRRRQKALILVGIVCLGTGAWFAYFRVGSVTPGEQGRSRVQVNTVTSPLISDSLYLNTQPEAAFVGA